MDRRHLLQGTAVLGLSSLAGCTEMLEEHFQVGVRSPIPIEIHHEGTTTQQVTLEASEPGSGRQSYDESYSVTPGESVLPPRLEGTEQRLRITLLTPEPQTEEVTVTPETQLIRITIRDETLEVDVTMRGGANETDGPSSPQG